jgi:UDPglucose 6-dehydrogenase
METKKERLGIIGQGFVGTAIREKFKKHFFIQAYDKFHSDKCVSYEDDLILIEEKNCIETIVSCCDITFVCVPTPMFHNGKCDTSIVQSVIIDLAKECEKRDKSIIAIVKSTIPPGTTKELNKISSNVTVVFSPEFLTEANANEDFKNQNRIILGIDWMEAVEPVMNIFAKVFTSDVKTMVVPSKEAEMTKYTTNLFLASKVSFFNDIYRICDTLNIDYDVVREASLLDPRIGDSHTAVPGPDGDFGYGGHCFPKDMQALLFLSTEYKLAIPTIMGAHTTNQIVRKNKDWETMKGRAISISKEEEEE